MTKTEFENLINDDVNEKIVITDGEYHAIIELVYMYHPAISTKEDIAQLYLKYGMTVIEDMVGRSEEVKNLENEIAQAKAKLDGLKEAMRKVKSSR